MAELVKPIEFEKAMDFIYKHLDRCFNTEGDVTTKVLIEITPFNITLRQSSYIDKNISTDLKINSYSFK